MIQSLSDSPSIRIQPLGHSTQLLLSGCGGGGNIKLWVPEAVNSDSGTCAVYPAGDPWIQHGDIWVQKISAEHSNGPGNYPKIDAHAYECLGIRIPADQPVSWKTTVRAEPRGVSFTIQITNEGRDTICKAVAMVCIKFMQAAWWSDQRVYVQASGRLQSLAELGRNAGRDPSLQAYLLDGESYAHPFINQYWGINRHRLDLPMMVSHCEAAEEIVTVTASRAYFLHCNRSNPCTDLGLAFGDVPMGGCAEASGRIRVEQATPKAYFESHPEK